MGREGNQQLRHAHPYLKIILKHMQVGGYEVSIYSRLIMSNEFTFTKQIESLNQTISPIAKPIPKQQNQLHSRMSLARTQLKRELEQSIFINK